MGTRFGDYEVLEPIAEGSTGMVFMARHVGLDRVAAIKQLSPALRGQPGFVERLRTEAGVLAGLSHPNIVDVYDFVEETERVWLVEQWVEGMSLATILDTYGPLTPEQSVGVVRGAMAGLAHVHDQGVVHRDVSSSNILADMAGTSMLVDFGMAGPAGSGTGSATGTPAFLSPEAARGEIVGKPGDVYSAAAVLYLLLTGRPVFAGSAAQVVRQHLEAAAPRLSDHGSELESLVARSLAKDPAARPEDAGEFLAALEQAARRRFGEGWLERASIAGVVGSVAAGAGISAASGVATGGAAETVVVDAALGAIHPPPPGPSSAGKPVRSAAAKAGIVIGGVVVTIGAVTGVVVAAGGDGGDDPAATSALNEAEEAASSRSESPAADPVVDLAPAGKWVLRSEIVRSTNSFFPVGKKETFTWRLLLDCQDPSDCGGDVKSSSGNKFEFGWDGTELVIQRDTAVGEGPCRSDETGEEVPGTHAKETVRFGDVTMRPTNFDRDGVPVRFEGRANENRFVTELQGDCRNNYADTGDPSPNITESWTLQAR
jgi:eukaryotic-like serine/threonine-protein kinase